MRKESIVIIALTFVVALGILPAEAQKGPIKVGFMSSLTGPLSPNGKDMLNSFELLLEEQGGKLAGREVKLFTKNVLETPGPVSPNFRGWARDKGFKPSSGLLPRPVGSAIVT